MEEENGQAKTNAQLTSLFIVTFLVTEWSSWARFMWPIVNKCNPTADVYKWALDRKHEHFILTNLPYLFLEVIRLYPFSICTHQLCVFSVKYLLIPCKHLIDSFQNLNIYSVTKMELLAEVAKLEFYSQHAT